MLFFQAIVKKVKSTVLSPVLQKFRNIKKIKKQFLNKVFKKQILIER